MDWLLRIPHGLIRRHLSQIERGLIAAALAGVMYMLMRGLPAYPSPWEVVIASAIFFVMLWSPVAGFFVAALAALMPLTSISIYVAVLFTCVALLGQRIFKYHLGAVLLVAAAPWLAQAHLAWIVPLLGGLWWGKSGGAWMGGMAALWGLLLAGMCGQPADWLLIGDTPLALNVLIARFGQANSLQTLTLIVSPLASDATLLLYHLLQVALWAMIAGLIGGLTERAWAQRGALSGNLLLAAGGATLLAGGHLGLAYWLQPYTDAVLLERVGSLARMALFSVAAVSIVEIVRDFIEHPFPTRQPWKPETLAASVGASSSAPSGRPQARGAGLRLPAFLRRKSAPEAAKAGQLPPDFTPLPVPPNLPKGERKKQQPDDLIKIELD